MFLQQIIRIYYLFDEHNLLANDSSKFDMVVPQYKLPYI